MSKSKAAEYNIVVVGCTDPELYGPYESDGERQQAALRIQRDELSEEDAIFALSIDKNGTPSVFPYSGGFFEEGLVCRNDAVYDAEENLLGEFLDDRFVPSKFLLEKDSDYQELVDQFAQDQLEADRRDHKRGLYGDE